MANSFSYKDTTYKIGDTLEVEYKIKEGGKERIQAFRGILIKYRGDKPETKMFNVRKVSKSGIGVERIFPLSSPFISSIKHIKKSSYNKAKLYFIRGLSDTELRSKLYHR